MLRATLLGAVALVALLAACTSEGSDDVSDTPSVRQPATPSSASESAASPSPSGSPPPGTPSPAGSASVQATNTSPTTIPATLSPSGSSQPTPSPTGPPAAASPTGSTQRVVSPDPLFQVFVDMAAADLAARLNISLAAISVAEAKALTWNDGGLGCPRPGMVYTQAVQDGVFIRLIAGGKSYPYHQGGSRPIFLCEQDIR